MRLHGECLGVTYPPLARAFECGSAGRVGSDWMPCRRLRGKLQSARGGRPETSGSAVFRVQTLICVAGAYILASGLAERGGTYWQARGKASAGVYGPLWRIQ